MDWNAKLQQQKEAVGHPAKVSLSDAHALEYKKLYEEDFGEEISLEEARAIGLRLITLYKLLSEPLPQDEPTPPSSADPPSLAQRPEPPHASRSRTFTRHGAAARLYPT